MNNHAIRNEFARKLEKQDFVIDKSGVKLLEIFNANFVVDEDTIFGEVNLDYANRELSWYKSQSLNVNDIPGGAPAIWKQVADKDGLINSNYGWCVLSSNNYSQYYHVLEELRASPDSRRAIMIYNRPSMWNDYYHNGRSDFMCTTSVHYMIRNGKLHAIVSMRSNDVIFGFRNDYHWQKYVLNNLSYDLQIPAGDIHWNANSFHIYERHFYLVDHWVKTRELNITKSDYDKLYAK